ncbi:MAG: hypothetical protein VB118_12830 [Oscillospiraceae bacterium]|nr:hypothetical protein [Oscillospiraceae bacterium]
MLLREQPAPWRNAPVFVLQGGFDKEKLRGICRVMMSFIQKQLSKKDHLTPAEQDSLDLLRNGGDHVTSAALDPVDLWLAEHV